MFADSSFTGFYICHFLSGLFYLFTFSFFAFLIACCAFGHVLCIFCDLMQSLQWFLWFFFQFLSCAIEVPISYFPIISSFFLSCFFVCVIAFFIFLLLFIHAVMLCYSFPLLCRNFQLVWNVFIFILCVFFCDFSIDMQFYIS